MIKVIGTAAAVALAASTAWVAAQDAPAGDQRGRKGRDAASLIERYDADKDGKLDQQELEAAHAARGEAMKARMLERFDANKNGVLDPEEREAAKAAREQRRAELVKRFDANGDGKLDQTEREAARKEFRGRRGEGRPEQN
jgi:Ca2+-binding EF-hand superfamily protein